MAGPLSKDLRERLVRAVDREGMSCRSAAARFDVAACTAIRWVQHFRKEGRLSPRKMGNPSPPKLAAHREVVLGMLAADPDITIEGLRHDLAARGIVIGYGSIRRFFAREGVTRKKRH